MNRLAHVSYDCVCGCVGEMLWAVPEGGFSASGGICVARKDNERVVSGVNEWGCVGANI